MTESRFRDFINDNARKAGYSSYEEYLLSVHWRDKKAEYYSQEGKHCKVCGKKNTVIQLHHKHYNSLGKEKISDLVSLCRKHHNIAHLKQNRNKYKGRLSIQKSIGFYRSQLWTGKDQTKHCLNSPVKTYFVDPESIRKNK